MCRRCCTREQAESAGVTCDHTCQRHGRSARHLADGTARSGGTLPHPQPTFSTLCYTRHFYCRHMRHWWRGDSVVTQCGTSQQQHERQQCHGSHRRQRHAGRPAHQHPALHHVRLCAHRASQNTDHDSLAVVSSEWSRNTRFRITASSCYCTLLLLHPAITAPCYYYTLLLLHPAVTALSVLGILTTSAVVLPRGCRGDKFSTRCHQLLCSPLTRLHRIIRCVSLSVPPPPCNGVIKC